MTSANKAPVFFVSHGAPTFAVEPGHLGPRLNALGKTLKDIRAILVVSPHWQSQGIKVATTPTPETIHDFGGFPAALYKLQYPAAGAPEIAKEVAELLSKAGWSSRIDESRGLDHGAWVPMMHLLPEADIPVFQVSMPHDLNAQTAFKLGQTLAPLREQGILILASGSMTHNLYEFRYGDTRPDAYATEFTTWVRDTVVKHDTDKMQNYRRLAPHAERAHPTDEHFLPLLVALGASDAAEEVDVLDVGIEHGVLSMESYAWGASA